MGCFVPVGRPAVHGSLRRPRPEGARTAGSRPPRPEGAPSTCSQAPAASARRRSRRTGRDEPVFTSTPACAQMIAGPALPRQRLAERIRADAPPGRRRRPSRHRPHAPRPTNRSARGSGRVASFRPVNTRICGAPGQALLPRRPTPTSCRTWLRAAASAVAWAITAGARSRTRTTAPRGRRSRSASQAPAVSSATAAGRSPAT